MQVKEFSGIYGVPRGGLCLAVALSHKLKIKLISEPIKNSLIVDDVYETGITLSTFKNTEGAMFFVLFSKIKPTWWNTLHITKKSQWAYEVASSNFHDLKDCDCIFAIVNGNPPDEGVMIELGIAIALKKKIFLFRDDFRNCSDSDQYPCYFLVCLKIIGKNIILNHYEI